ncbi:MAG: CheB methylesterase domain-containing protein, partial [Gemmatimonadales bacterium]|nr:CheB methylesterase domain-containing protein [Gemmatimonadales bacterium]
RAPSAAAAPAPKPGAPPRLAAPPLRTVPVEGVCIGVSTGGPNALAALLPALPADLAVPIVIVQHMPPVFTRFLAERLAQRCPFPVTEAQDGEPARAGHAYIAPGDHHVVLEKRAGGAVLHLTQEPPENSCRPAVDVLFRSAAATWGAGTLAVVLTGMGSDGARGARTVHEAGGRVLVQDEASSVVWGMPGAVAATGSAERIVPLAELPAEIVRRLPAVAPAGR